MRIVSRTMVRAALVTTGFFAGVLLAQQQTQPSTPTDGLPGSQDILAYLNQSIDWRQRITAQEQIVTDSADETFLNSGKQISLQVLRLSFDFARSAVLAGAGTANPAAEERNGQPTQHQALTAAFTKAQNDLKETQAELEADRQKLKTATKQRRELQATVDELESEANLAQARADALGEMLQFATTGSARSTGSLPAQIEELQRTVPELETTATPGTRTGSTTPTATASTSAANASRTNRAEPSGVLGLITDLIALNRKVSTLDESLKATTELQASAKQLRAPLRAAVMALTQQGEQIANQADTSDPAQLEQEKRQLDGVTAGFRRLSSVSAPLSKQSMLLDLYVTNVTDWRAAVKAQSSVDVRSLLLRLIVFGIVIGIAFALAEIWRKAIFRYVHDVRRRYQFLLLRRIVLWCVIGITIAFALASEIGSLATFAGLITAGVAVALQNVILAVAGYFFLIGKYGVRVGDRVQISGVTGQVIDIGLIRLHLMELSGPDSGWQPTGRVVVFSNAVVFQPAASFFKQIPGANFLWHEVSLTLAPDTNYHVAEERIMQAVEKVYSSYRERIEQQHRDMEHSLNFAVAAPQPQSRLRLTQIGLEIIVRYPVELDGSSRIDDQITRELLIALDKSPKLKLVGSGTPNIQAVIEPATAS